MAGKKIPPSFKSEVEEDGIVAERAVRLNKPQKDSKPKAKKKKTGGKPPSDGFLARMAASWKWKIAIILFKVFLVLSALGFIGGFFVVTYYAHDLPDINKLYSEKLKPSTTILDADGNVVRSYGDVFTEFVEYDDLPQSLVDAVTATEDRRFFKHFGVDPIGLARAAAVNLWAGGVVQGGSTITQQLAKIVFLKPERAMKRKIQEAVLAIWLEQKFNKKQILSMYLNRVYLGAGIYGVDAAARKYFGKRVRDLNLYESAMIAGLLKAPTTYAPTNNPRAAADRTETVLLAMVDAEKITEKQRKRAVERGTQVQSSKIRENSRYYTDYIMEILPQYVSNPTENLIIKTTFQPKIQRYAEDAILLNILQTSDAIGAAQAALVAMRPDGAILAMVGGVDYDDSQFNRATQAKRQAGSLFKLFVYLAALEAGMKPSDTVLDAPFSVKIDGKTWQPKNYTGKYEGEVTLAKALAHSLNAATVRLSEGIGRDRVIALARRMGIHSSLQDFPSVALGAAEVTLLEMTQAFAHLPNSGKAVAPFAIEEIRTQKGEVLYQREGDFEVKVLGINAVKMMNGMLKGVVENGTGKAAQIGRDVAGKTGTTQNYRDAWFVGYTPQLVAGVWVGNDKNKAMQKVTGGSIPARIWHDFSAATLAETPAVEIDTNPYPEIKGTPWKASTAQDFWDDLAGE